ncbi:OmpA/MotB family protein [Mucilaginibacter ginkgonis]|uniref:OmpA family protein n=1 Tax=Mucilaginibacter ginkgonis TaxID=2682091 RepID=A0A6I4I3Z9_9SPHI|nr:OmpA family protein [Mucilaginibacter ginkgonis]QQL48713.1 OmpA family protein [Mucilaginibacter ginkgonis]
MKIKHLLLILVAAATLHSCKILSNKAYKAMVDERDSLSTRTTTLEAQVAQLQADTMRIHAQLRELQGKYNTLNNDFNTANKNLDKTSSQVNQLSTDLQKREARLKEVEDILKRRDEATNALRAKLQQALLGFQQSGLSVDIRNGKVYVSLTDKLLFPSGSIVIDEKGKAALKQLAVVLNKETDINLSVEGHTDNKKVVNLGQIKDNWDLSVLRATSVARYLTETENIDPKRVTATGKGQFQPIDTGNTPEALARNRRIEIVLTPKLDELYNLITK